jgi:hypothetical protein
VKAWLAWISGAGRVVSGAGRVLVAAPVVAARALDIYVSRISARRIFWLTAIVNLALIGVVVAILVVPAREAQFSGLAVTETFRIQLPVGSIPPAGLADQLVAAKPGASPCAREVELFSPTKDPITLDFEVSDGTPSLLIRGSKAAARPYAVERRCDGSERDVTSSLRLHPFAGNGASTTLIVEGVATLGQPAGPGRPLLRSGTITASSSSLPFRSSRVAASSELMLGDQVRFFRSDDDDVGATANAIVRFDPAEKAFRISIQSGASKAEVTRLGSDSSFPLTVAPSFWARLQAQAEWAVLLFSLALVLNVISAARQYAEGNRTVTIREESDDPR